MTDSYTAEDARRDSALGALWMDEHCRGDWITLIDTDKLDLEMPTMCLWGQAWEVIVDPASVNRFAFRQGGYFRVLEFLGLYPAANAADGDWIAAHGFTADVDLRCPAREYAAAYEMLRCAWIEQINLRLADRAAAVEAAESALTDARPAAAHSFRPEGY